MATYGKTFNATCRWRQAPESQGLGTKEALAVRLRKRAIDGGKTLRELAYQQSFQV